MKKLLALLVIALVGSASLFAFDLGDIKGTKKHQENINSQSQLL